MVLYLLLERAIPGLDTNKRVLYLLIYAILIELVQHYLPTRVPSVSDVIADGVGIIVGVILVNYFRSLRICAYCYR